MMSTTSILCAQDLSTWTLEVAKTLSFVSPCFDFDPLVRPDSFLNSRILLYVDENLFLRNLLVRKLEITHLANSCQLDASVTQE